MTGKSITLGRLADGRALHLDLLKLIDSRLLVQGTSGSGKSNAVRLIVERAHEHVQCIVIDPEGEYATLREKFPFLLFGPGGERPADVHKAAMIARVVLEVGRSAVIDLSEAKGRDHILFVQRFAEGLMSAPRALRHPVLIPLEEAHLFAPEGAKSDATENVIDLAKRGRKRGFCLIPVTQRISDLSKAVAALCGNRLIGLTTLDTDVKRAAYDLGFETKDRRLTDLELGDFFAYGPAFGFKGVHQAHVEEAETKAPKLTAGHPKPPPPTPRALEGELARLDEIPKEVEEEARTLADALTENRRLKRELAAKPVPPAPVVKGPRTVTREVPALTAAERKSLNALVNETRTLAAKASGLDEKVGDLHTKAGDVFSRVTLFEQNVLARLQAPAATQEPGQSYSRIIPSRDPRPPQSPTSRLREVHTSPPAEGITGPEQRILDAAAWLEATTGVLEHEETAVAFLAGYTVGGGAFNNPRGALRTKGLITYPGSGRIALTDEGRAVSRPPAVAATPDEMQARVLERLDGPGQKLLRVLLEAYPEAVANDELARRAGYEPGGGAFNNPRGRLKTLGLVTYPERGLVKASPFLFLEGMGS